MKPKELMGKIVTVNAQYIKRKRIVPGRNWETNWETKTSHEKVALPSRAGWVVGYRTLHCGITENHYDDYPIFHPKKTIQCLLVAFWSTMNPIRVPLDSYEMGGEPCPPSHSWKESWKEEQREIMADWPRKPNGQWKSPGDMTKEEREKAFSYG